MSGAIEEGDTCICTSLLWRINIENRLSTCCLYCKGVSIFTMRRACARTPARNGYIGNTAGKFYVGIDITRTIEGQEVIKVLVLNLPCIQDCRSSNWNLFGWW